MAVDSGTAENVALTAGRRSTASRCFDDARRERAAYGLGRARRAHGHTQGKGDVMLALSFGEGLWLIIVSFLFIAYLMMLFSVIIDLFRDRDLRGGVKALWAVALIAFPLITMLVYLVVRGDGMAKRSINEQRQAQETFDSYVREVAGGGSASELATAAGLLDSGKISQDEYDKLKSKILA